MRNLLLSQFDRLAKRAFRKMLGRRIDSYDVLEVAHLKAAFESASYYERRMLRATPFPNDLALLTAAVAKARPDGLFLEFGVASGRTISHIANRHTGPVYGFDTFEGLPEHWRSGFEKGAFAGGEPTVPANVTLIKGLFSTTLPQFLKSYDSAAAFIHVDCDLYSSTKDILEILGPRIGRGSVIVFDEYFNYPGWRNDEFRAFQEFIRARRLKYEYIGFVPSHQQVGIIIADE